MGDQSSAGEWVQPEEDAGRTQRDGTEPGQDRGGDKGPRRGPSGAGSPEGPGGAGEDWGVRGSLFWQAGGAALQDRSHWQVRMSEPSSS